MEKGFKKPWEILLAQLHPVAFFGFDVFEFLFTALLKDTVIAITITEILKPFPFVCIDEIQVCVESSRVYRQPGSRNLLPFFSRWFTFLSV